MSYCFQESDVAWLLSSEILVWCSSLTNLKAESIGNLLWSEKLSKSIFLLKTFKSQMQFEMHLIFASGASNCFLSGHWLSRTNILSCCTTYIQFTWRSIALQLTFTNYLDSWHAMGVMISALRICHIFTLGKTLNLHLLNRRLTSQKQMLLMFTWI